MTKMADFDVSIGYVLDNEGGRYENLETGEITNFGISLRWLKTIDPEATAETIRHLSRDAAIDLYQKFWWNQNHVGLIPSQRIATKLFDHMVNMGAHTGVKLLQKTLNEPLETPASKIAEDGCIGPQVVQAINNEMKIQVGEEDILHAFAENLCQHYEEIAENNPAQKPNLENWLKRANKLPA